MEAGRCPFCPRKNRRNSPHSSTHGPAWVRGTYRKFINAGKFYNANVLVMGGDITGKLLIPIIKESNGSYRATLQGNQQQLTTEAELQGLEERIRNLGFYSQVMDGDEFKALQGDPVMVDGLFHELARKRLESWGSGRDAPGRDRDQMLRHRRE
jgi:hypothetical protein